MTRCVQVEEDMVQDHVEGQVPDEQPGEWVGLGEAANRLGVTVDTVRKRARKGELTSRRVPRPQGYAYQVHLVPDLVEDQDADQVPGQVDPPAPSADLVQMTAIMERLADENRRLSEQNVQLAGQLGFTTAQLQSAQERIALLEAPRPAENTTVVENAPQSASPRVWWRFWQRTTQTSS